MKAIMDGADCLVYQLGDTIVMSLVSFSVLSTCHITNSESLWNPQKQIQNIPTVNVSLSLWKQDVDQILGSLVQSGLYRIFCFWPVKSPQIISNGLMLKNWDKIFECTEITVPLTNLLKPRWWHCGFGSFCRLADNITHLWIHFTTAPTYRCISNPCCGKSLNYVFIYCKENSYQIYYSTLTPDCFNFL